MRKSACSFRRKCAAASVRTEGRHDFEQHVLAREAAQSWAKTGELSRMVRELRYYGMEDTGSCNRSSFWEGRARD